LQAPDYSVYKRLQTLQTLISWEQLRQFGSVHGWQPPLIIDCANQTLEVVSVNLIYLTSNAIIWAIHAQPVDSKRSIRAVFINEYLLETQDIEIDRSKYMPVLLQ